MLLGIILSQLFPWYYCYNFTSMKLVREIIAKKKRKEYSLIYLTDKESTHRVKIAIYGVMLFIILLSLLFINTTKYTLISQIIPGINAGATLFIAFAFLTSYYVIPSVRCIVLNDKIWEAAMIDGELGYKAYDWENIRSIDVRPEDSDTCTFVITTKRRESYYIGGAKGKAEKLKQKLIKHSPADVKVC